MNTCFFLKSDLLEDHQNKCEVEGKFVEAEMSKQKLAQLKRIEEEKLRLELKEKQAEERLMLENEQKAELDEFNRDWDSKFFELNNKYEQIGNDLAIAHQDEKEKKEKDFEENYPAEPKSNPESLNLQKILEQVVKRKE